MQIGKWVGESALGERESVGSSSRLHHCQQWSHERVLGRILGQRSLRAWLEFHGAVRSWISHDDGGVCYPLGGPWRWCMAPG